MSIHKNIHKFGRSILPITPHNPVHFTVFEQNMAEKMKAYSQLLIEFTFLSTDFNPFIVGL